MERNGGTVQYMDGAITLLRTNKTSGDVFKTDSTLKVIGPRTAVTATMMEITTHPITMTMEEEMEGQSEPSLHYQEEDKDIQQQTTSICYMYQERKPATVRKESKAQAPSKRECRNIRVQ